jgi:hypothetical protein
VRLEHARSEGRVGLTGEQRLEQVADLIRAVLEVGVEDRREATLRGGEGAPDAIALAAVALDGEHAHLIRPFARLQPLAGRVGRAVLDDDQLVAGDRERRVEDALDRGLDRRLLVVRGHQDRQVQGRLL